MNGRYEGQADGQGRVYQASGDQHITEHHHHAADWSGPDSVRHPSVGRAPVALRDRAELMGRLRGAVAADAGNQVFVLHGLGGCGKTAVAYTLFRYATLEAGRLGFWVNASEQASLRAGMLALAADRGAGEAELMAARGGLRAAADLVWDSLDRSDQPWLLVLDNADDPAVLRDGGWVRTSRRGTVVVTTRQAGAHWWPAAELLQVGVLPREEAAQVLCDLAPGTGTVEEAAAIADRLGRLPLALTLAGGFLAHQVIQPWTMTEYGGHLGSDHGTDPIELIDQGAAVGNDSRHLVGRTWQLSLDSLVRQGMPEAVALLRLLACWSNDPLPVALLAGAELGPGLPAFRVESALRGLLDHSLTELVTTGVRCLRTHGVLLDSVARSTPDDQRESLMLVAVQRVAAVLPEHPERGVRDDRVDLLAPHVLMLMRRIAKWPTASRPTTELAVECVLRLAVAQHRAGDYTSALASAKQGAELGERSLGAEHPLVLRLRQRVGRTLFRLGRVAESETLHRQVLADCERLFGPTAPDTLESCVALSFPLWKAGTDTESVVLMRRAVAGRAEVLGRSHPLTLVARMYQLELEGPVSDEVLAGGPALIEDCHRETGPDHSITRTAELSYANAMFRSGRSRDALEPAREALRKHVIACGHEYLITVNCRDLLSLILADLGDFEEALEQAEMTAKWRTRVLGPAHPWTVIIQERVTTFRSRRPPPDGVPDVR